MISADLKQIYTSHTDTRRFYDTIQLYHPNFSTATGDAYPSEDSYPSNTSYPANGNIDLSSIFLIRDTEDKVLHLEDSSSVIYQSYPFSMVLPEQGSDQQDIGVVLSNVTNEVMVQLELASQNTDVPIKLFYRVYMDGSLDSQITPIELSITSVSVDMMQISATATRANLYDRRFPFGGSTIYDQRFTGLFI